MSSTQRYYAQRNTNITGIVPVPYSDKLTFGNITNAAIYTLNINELQYVKGIYYVDLAGVDASGNPLDFTGTFAPITGSNTINIICFVVNIETNASFYPGLDFTLSFKNVPLTMGNPFLTIGLITPSSLDGQTIPLPYVVSPPFPLLAGQSISPNITFKSDGDNFDVAASGPAGWMGVPALASVLTAWQMI